MQYMLLIYGDMSAFAEMTEEEQNANMQGWYRLHRRGSARRAG